MKISSIIIGTIIAVVVIIMGFKLVQNVFTRASDVEPRDVVVSEVSQNSAKLSWASGIETQGVVEYGTSPTALNFFSPEGQKTKNHSVDLTLLSPSTTYYFQIKIGGEKYDNGGVPWTFSTKGTAEPTHPPPTATVQPTVAAATPTSAVSSTCTETDCQKIKDKLGKGCDTQDYQRCIRALTPTTAL